MGGMKMAKGKKLVPAKKLEKKQTLCMPTAVE